MVFSTDSPPKSHLITTTTKNAAEVCESVGSLTNSLNQTLDGSHSSVWQWVLAFCFCLIMSRTVNAFEKGVGWGK